LGGTTGFLRKKGKWVKKKGGRGKGDGYVRKNKGEGKKSANICTS